MDKFRFPSTPAYGSNVNYRGRCVIGKRDICARVCNTDECRFWRAAFVKAGITDSRSQCGNPLPHHTRYPSTAYKSKRSAKFVYQDKRLVEALCKLRYLPPCHGKVVKPTVEIIFSVIPKFDCLRRAVEYVPTFGFLRQDTH